MAEQRTPGPGPDYSKGDQSHSHSGERQRWSEAPHEQLVEAFRGLIQQERQKAPYDYAPRPPAIIIAGELWNQMLAHASPDPLDKQRAAFYRQIHTAWEIIANEQYEFLGRGERSALYPVYEARLHLFNTYTRAKEHHEPRPELITLDPLQVKILDALAEAADVPRQRGQAEIEMPQYIREYEDRGFDVWVRAEIERRRGKQTEDYKVYEADLDRRSGGNTAGNRKYRTPKYSGVDDPNYLAGLRRLARYMK